MIREELLAPIVSAIRRGTALPAQEILRYLADWEVVPGEFNGEHAWVAVLKGTEIHFALAPGWRPQPGARGAVSRFIGALLDRRGFLTTRILHSQTRQQKFVERVGFKPTWHDEQMKYYLLGRPPFERKR